VETTRFGISCRYSTNNTTIGTLTSGSPATVDLAANIPFHSGSVFCGSGATTLTGSYKLTSPSSLFVDGNLDPEPSTFLTAPTGTIATPTLKAESEGHISLDHPIAKLQCNWSFEGTVKSHGEENNVKVPLSGLSTTGCTEDWHATTVTSGELEIDWSSGYSGTVVWTGGTVDMTRLGTIFRYKAENMHLGTLIGGSPAKLNISGKMAFHSGSPLCGEEAYSLTGSLKVTSPSALFVDGDPGPEPARALTSPTGSVSTSSIYAQSESALVLDSPVAKIECNVNFGGYSEESGEGLPAFEIMTSLGFSECSNEWHGKTYSGGRLEIDWTSGYNGTVKWTGGTFELTRLGLVCRYATDHTDIGTITGGSPGTLHINAAIPFHSGSIGCPNGTGATTMTGSFKLTSPSSLYVDDN
jgi:hypothetical protein